METTTAAVPPHPSPLPPARQQRLWASGGRWPIPHNSIVNSDTASLAADRSTVPTLPRQLQESAGTRPKDIVQEGF